MMMTGMMMMEKMGGEDRGAEGSGAEGSGGSADGSGNSRAEEPTTSRLTQAMMTMQKAKKLLGLRKMLRQKTPKNAPTVKQV